MGPVTQEDPIGIAGGLNLYGYANGDPINFSDPFGLCPPEDDEPCSWGQRLANWGAKEGGALGKLALNVGAGFEAGLAAANAATGSSSTCEDGVCYGTAPLAGIPGAAINNAIPSAFARVVPGGISASTLGPAGATDVFVTAADDIAGLGARALAQRLGIPSSSSFRVIEFSSSGVSGVGSPILRTNPGFVGRGLTSGGAREFVIPNGPIPFGATTRVVR